VEKWGGDGGVCERGIGAGWGKGVGVMVGERGGGRFHEGAVSVFSSTKGVSWELLWRN